MTRIRKNTSAASRALWSTAVVALLLGALAFPAAADDNETPRTTQCGPIPPNDSTANPIDLGVVGTTAVNASGTTTCATGEGSEGAATPTGVGELNSVHYVFTAEQTGSATVSTCSANTNYDSWLGIWPDSRPRTWPFGATPIATDDDARGLGEDFCGVPPVGSFAAQITVPVIAGETYWIQVDGFEDRVGDFGLSVQQVFCRFELGLAPATQVGSAGDDVLGETAGLRGTPGPDTIVARGGDDIIAGLAGDDLICAGSGDDRVLAGRGFDLVAGQGGDDALRGGPEPDLLWGGFGNDVLAGNADEDGLMGGSGSDRLNGGIGDDELFGNAGDDRLRGLPGDDFLRGGLGFDRLFGGDDIDICIGEVKIGCEG